MPTVPDRLNTLMLSANDETRKTAATSFATFARRLEEAVSFDWTTGLADVNEAAARSAAEDLQRSTSFAVGAAFPDEVMENARGGFAVLRNNGRELIPWNSLRDPAVVHRIPEAQLESLGVTAASPETVLKDMSVRFPDLPASIDTSVTKLLANSLYDQRIVTVAQSGDARLETLIRGRLGEDIAPRRIPDNDGGDEKTEAAVSLGGILDGIADLANQFVTECLPTIEPHWATFSTGLGIEMNRDCTLRLVQILRGGGAPVLAAAGAAAIASAGAGISVALAAALTAVGGWAVLIVAACVLAFSGWLELVVTDAGAVIHFPWWAGFGPIPYGR